MRRILVIDDSALIRKAAEIGLSRAGWTTVLADGGLAGLTLAAAEPPDAVLLDLMMPGLGGEEVLARLRAAPATAAVPVVLLTASPEAAAGHGADGVIPKPFPPLELAGMMRAALGWDDAAG